jgi:hypothetical protein
MNWDAVGALAELAGAVAVVASIGYLALQVRQNSRFSRAASQQVFISQSAGRLRALVDRPENLRIARSALVSFRALAPDDQAVAHGLFNEWITQFEQAYYLHATGLLPDAVFDTSRVIALSLLASPGGAQYWEVGKALVGPDVRRDLDAQLGAGIDLPALTDALPWLRSG